MFCYESQTPDERHLAELMGRLPSMQEIQDRLQAHREACALWGKYQGVDDLGSAIEELEAEGPFEMPQGHRLFDVLLREKKLAYQSEKARLDHDIARSRFGTILEANAARMNPDEAKRLEAELNAFREDYALTLAKCQATK